MRRSAGQLVAALLWCTVLVGCADTPVGPGLRASALSAAPTTTWLVGTPSTADARAGLEGRLLALGVRIDRRFHLIDALSLSVDDPGTDALIRALAADAAVRWFERDAPIQPAALPLATPDDPLWPSLWGLHNEGQTGGLAGVDVNALSAWARRTASSEVTIAVVDTGVDTSHPDLAEALWVNEAEAAGLPGVDDDNNGHTDDLHGWSFWGDSAEIFRGDEDWHGTLVAGLLAARGHDGVGTIGLAHGARVMVLKFMGGKNVTGTTANAIAALEYADDQGVSVVNASWGTSQQSTAMAEALAAMDALVVVAAGNAKKNLDTSPSWPASFDLPNILVVGAVDPSGSLATGWGDDGTLGSNWGAQSVDIVAPGDRIRGALPGGFGSRSGTSFAAPFASATAALLLSEDPTLDAPALRAALMESVRPLPQLGSKTLTGGLLDADAALTWLGVPPAPSALYQTLTGSEVVSWAVRGSTREVEWTPLTAPPPGAILRQARFFVSARASGGGSVRLDLLDATGTAHLVWAHTLGPGELLSRHWQCGAGPSGSCDLAVGAALRTPPFALVLKATGDARLKLHAAAYSWVWR